jgi:hypothetical protein
MPRCRLCAAFPNLLTTQRTAPSTMHYLDRLHRPSFGGIGWVRIRSAKRAEQCQHSLGIDEAAESMMLRELSGAPDLGELIEPGSIFSAIGHQFAPIHTALYRQQGDCRPDRRAQHG